MSTPGIHNPFAPIKKKKKKKKFLSAYDEIDTEIGPPKPPVTTLDGDTYVLRLQGIATVTDAADKLISLLYAVNREHHKSLNGNGIRVVGANEKIVASKDEMLLERSNGSICVFVGSDVHNETSVFKRIGYTLNRLPILDLLKKHNVQIYRRG